MIRRSFVTTAVLMAAALIYVLQQCSVLIPYRRLLFNLHWPQMATFTAVLFVNLWLLVHVLSRTIALRHTGRKLEHLDRQAQGEGYLEDLAELMGDDQR